MLKAFFISLILSLSFYSFSSSQTSKPKNVILFIGDGMGPAHVTTLTTVKNPCNMERFPVGGLIKTHSADNYITDSAAGATALATGYKTNDKYLSISPDGKPLKTVLEYAEDSEKSTGLVVTCEFTHATPAAFAAHIKDREKYYEIARQIVNSGVDVIMGGAKGIYPEDEDVYPRDSLLNLLKDKMKVITDTTGFRAVQNVKQFTYFFDPDEPGKADERPTSLREMTEKAIQILSQNEKGFFLMVEGSQIDWGGHDEDIDYIIEELIDFDDALGAGLDFAEKDNNTLIIVTADHETGGLSLLDGSLYDKKVTDVDFSTDEHSAVMVPLFAYGPQSSLFGGIHENTFVGKQLIEFMK